MGMEGEEGDKKTTREIFDQREIIKGINEADNGKKGIQSLSKD